MKKLVLLLFSIVCIHVSSVKAQDFVVIVNANNPANSISKSELSKIFLKKTSKFSSGSNAVPVDLADGAARESFSKEVLSRSLSAIKNYWSQQLFSGASFPPEEKNTDAEVVSFVSSEPGGVGYVSAGFDLSGASGVKAITVE